jgi:hypothetical protein
VSACNDFAYIYGLDDWKKELVNTALESNLPSNIIPSTNMKLSLSALFLAACGLVHSTPTSRADKPPRFFLIGDSTVAVNGGWGDGLLSYLNGPAEGDNRGVSGSTTVSWKSSGRWDTLLKDVGAAKNDFEPVVTIQFGHNDQKVMQLDEFHSNLVSIGNDIKNAGGTPVSQLLYTLPCSL